MSIFMKTFIFLMLVSLSLSLSIFTKKQTQIQTKTQQQTQQNAQVQSLPDKLFAGEIHYSRIPVEYWQHRLQMVKALGLNAISVYVMWNYHEISKGKFDYATQNKNLTLFLQLATKYQLKVLFRPGPYVCAQWDFGGFPSRLLNIDGLVLRANNQAYLKQVKIYFQSLVPIITPFITKNTIILLQIQNQYGAYGPDKAYIEALRQMWINLNITCPQYYVDWIDSITRSHWQGANIGINNGITQSQWDYVRSFQKNGYLLGGEIYSGWLTHWGENWQSKSAERNQLEYGFLMSNNHSFSMYMVHGGTNFGLTAGANAYSGGQPYDFKGHVTSYDYDAPINEQGSASAKYITLRNLIKKYANWTVPEIPQPIKTIQIPRFTLSYTSTLLNSLGTPVLTNSSLKTFQTDQLQMYNQGIVVYQTKLTKKQYVFFASVHDYALVYLDGVHVRTLDRSVSTYHILNVTCSLSVCELNVVVQAMGHVNYDKQMQTDRKGLIDFEDDSSTNLLWNIYTFPLEKVPTWANFIAPTNAPTVLKATVTLSQAGDVYLDVSELDKGYVWVNGRNLGRYWKKGPQTRLFCPGVWLKKGDNLIQVLELHYNNVQKGITGKKALQSSQDKILLEL